MTRAQTLVPSQTLANDAALILGGTLVTTLAARVEVPFIPVPFTLQTLAVALCGLTLGARRGAASQALYLAAGAAGLPVFAEFKTGAALVGPTGGFLWGFVVAAAILGFFAEREWDRKPLLCGAALAIGLSSILALGTAWLGLQIGFVKAFQVGCLPFIPGEIMKAAAAMLALPMAWKLVGKK